MCSPQVAGFIKLTSGITCVSPHHLAMKVIILSLVLATIAVSYVTSQQCHMREVDLCVTTLVFHFQSSGIPDDDEKVDEWCENVAEVRDCMGNYSEKCMSPMQRELGQLLSGGTSTAERQLCTAGSELRKDYLQHAPCLAQGSESDTFKSNLRDLQVSIETIFEVEFKKRLPAFCCGARRFHKSTEDNAKRRCGDDAVDMLKLIMDTIFTELPKTICQNFDPESDTCKEVLPPPGTTPKGTRSKSQISKLLDTVISNL